MTPLVWFILAAVFVDCFKEAPESRVRNAQKLAVLVVVFLWGVVMLIK
jgi:hypothetical protein